MLNQTKTNPSMAEFAFSTQALLDSHECVLKQQESQKDVPIHMYQATAAATMQGLSECRITDLITTVGHRARGNVLHGTVCTQSLRRRSLQTMIEDEHGDVVLVSLYNIPAIELPHWRECFPVGMKLGIREPFFKRQADSTFAIRVDFPSDVIYVSKVCAWHVSR